MMSAAFFWPMPWMYWSAISTRLLVGIFTPAIRATNFSPVADPSRDGPLRFCCLGQVSANANTTPCPLIVWDPASSINYPTWMPRLLMDSGAFRQPPLSFSSPFRYLFRSLPGDLPGRLLHRPGSPFCGLAGRFGGLFGYPAAFGDLFRRRSGDLSDASASGSSSPPPGRGHLARHGPDGGQDAADLARDVLDRHHAVHGQELAPLRIVVNQRL